MKPYFRFRACGSIVFTFLLIATGSTIAAQLKDATITQIVNDVKLQPGQAAARSAVLNDRVSEGTEVHAGTNSRAELTF